MTDIAALFDKRFGELTDSVADLPDKLAKRARVYEYEKQRTKKIIRFPIISGVVASAAVSFGGDVGEQLVSPEEGYIWSVRELNVEGLARGGTPDVVKIFRNQAVAGKIFWELNGNQYLQTFGFGEKILFPGDSLLVQNFGALTAANGTSIVLSGLAFEVASERMGELFGGS